MKNRDILYAITKQLKSKLKNYKILVDGNNKEITEPTFSLSLRPLSTTSRADQEKIINITLTYTNEKVTQEERLDVIDIYNSIFQSKLKVLNRFLTIDNLEFDSTNELVNCSFTLKFFDTLEDTYNDTEVYEKMEILHIEE